MHEVLTFYVLLWYTVYNCDIGKKKGRGDYHEQACDESE